MEEEKKEKKIALLVWHNEKAVITAAAFMKSHKRLKIKTEDIFVVDLNKLDNDFPKYEKIIVIDPENKYREIAGFFIFNRQRIDHWLAGPGLMLPNSSILKYYIADKLQEKTLDEYIGEDLELLSFLRAIKAKKQLKYEPESISRHKAAIHTAKIKFGKRGSELDRVLKEILIEFISQEKSPFIEELLFEATELKVTLNKAKKKEFNYEGIGIIKIVEPKPGYFVNVKEIFEEGLRGGYNAVAIKNPESGELEICLKKEFFEKIPADKIVRRVNGSRVVVVKNFFD